MKVLKIPAKLGACADLLYRLRAERLKAAALVEDMKAQEKQLADHLSANLKADDAAGIMGQVAQVTLHSLRVGKVVDWKAFYAYVSQTGQFELLQRRLNDPALRERWDQSEAVPGVTPQTVLHVSITKRGG